MNQLSYKAGALPCRMRDIRESMGLSLQDVADGCGLLKANVHKIEKGRDVPLSKARAIAAFLNRSIEEIWPQ